MRISVSLTLAIVGCGSMDATEPAAGGVGTIRSELVTGNGADLNGADLNGADLNGADLNGADLNGSRLGSTLVAVHFAPTEIRGAPAAVWLERGEIHGIDASGTAFAGAGAQGLVLVGERGDGALVKLRIQGITEEGGGVWRYGFLYKPGADNVWDPLCSNGSAIVVSGRWNYEDAVPGGGAFTPDSTVFTVACAGSAIEKCVTHLGYRPWERFGPFGTVSGVDLHTSCVRAIRADYCGDGHSHTTNGRLINIYDGAGVQQDTEAWTLEAEWTPDGARCVSAVARDALGITCAPVLDALTCGDTSHFGTGSRQMTETLFGPVPIAGDPLPTLGL